jgi:hypothetical protein
MRRLGLLTTIARGWHCPVRTVVTGAIRAERISGEFLTQRGGAASVTQRGTPAREPATARPETLGTPESTP